MPATATPNPTPSGPVVSFTRMEDGTREDYALLASLEDEFAAGTADRVLAHLRQLSGSVGGYQVDRLEHSLQSATRAHRDGAEEEMVVAALLHDIDDLLAPHSHGELAALLLRPFVTERTHWIVRHHGLFQLVYYAHHLGRDRNARDKYRDHPWYQDAVDFCHRWDQSSFDPEYESLPLEFFEPMVRRIFAREPFSLWPRGGS
ncbi:MAG: peptidase [Gemmatimonadales bacterium]|nr:peptidase [Gemmatimonadales bacterium]MYG48140.1 peptidase [Gemmatimonadales bacterium]MYK00698.1 peptidase [Candidatus Palauibacter ramosifaciens]